MHISINKPCNENWDEMIPNQQGAFCAVCAKNVVDFSKKSIREIKSYFSQPKEGKICGKFDHRQLSELSFDSFFERFSGFRLNRKVAIVIVTAFFSWFIGMGNGVAQTSTNKVGKIKITPTKTTVPVKAIKKPKDTTKSVKQFDARPVKGEVYIAPAPPKRKEGE